MCFPDLNTLKYPSNEIIYRGSNIQSICLSEHIAEYCEMLSSHYLFEKKLCSSYQNKLVGVNDRWKRFRKTTLFTPNIWRSHFPVQMFPLMPAARERQASAARLISLGFQVRPSLITSHMLMESEGSTFGIIWLLVCEQRLALAGGRSSSLKHFNAEILAFPITLAERVFTPRLNIPEVRRARNI